MAKADKSLFISRKHEKLLSFRRFLRLPSTLFGPVASIEAVALTKILNLNTFIEAPRIWPDESAETFREKRFLRNCSGQILRHIKERFLAIVSHGGCQLYPDGVLEMFLSPSRPDLAHKNCRVLSNFIY